MLNLVAVLELVVDGFNEVPFAEDELVPEWQQSVLHVFLDAGYELRPLAPKHLKKIFRDVASVGIQLAVKLLAEFCSQLRVVVGYIPRSQHERGKFTPLIDDQVEFEAVEPAHTAFASGGNTFEDFVSPNPVVVADNHLGGVDEIGECRYSQQVKQQGMQWYVRIAHELNEPTVADEHREISGEMHTDVVDVVSLECFVITLVEVNENGQYFAQRQGGRFDPLGFTRRKQVCLPLWLKLFAKLIHEVE